MTGQFSSIQREKCLVRNSDRYKSVKTLADKLFVVSLNSLSIAMSASVLRIVTFGIDHNIARRVCDQLRARSIDAESYVVENTPASDSEIASILKAKQWDGLIIGRGVQENHAWYERVLDIAKDANPNVPLIRNEGHKDLIGDIERHFKIQLPPAST